MKQFASYFTNGFQFNAQEHAYEHPFWKERIFPGGPYFTTKYNHEGVNGVLIYQKTMLPGGKWDDAHPPIYTTDKGKGREVYREGDKFIIYFSPKEMPAQCDVGRPKINKSVDITTESGINLSIPICYYTPRLLDFNSYDVQDTSQSAYAKKVAWFYEQSKAGEKVENKHLIELVGLAVMENYRVTRDMLNDFGWLQTSDVSTILDAILGKSPKGTPSV